MSDEGSFRFPDAATGFVADPDEIYNRWHCLECQVRWDGRVTVFCWICSEVGIPAIKRPKTTRGYVI